MNILKRVGAVFWFLWMFFVGFGGTVVSCLYKSTELFGWVSTIVMIVMVIGFPRIVAAPILYLVDESWD